MSTLALSLKPVPLPTAKRLRTEPAVQALTMLRVTFALAPILFGVDKFAHVLTDDWTRYLSTQFNDILPGSASTGMHIVGVVEILAGLVVAIAPRLGGLLVAAWLGGIVVNLLLVGGYGDIALRDFGLMTGALTLARLAFGYGGSQDQVLPISTPIPSTIAPPSVTAISDERSETLRNR